MFDLTDRVALVTGGAHGIGFEYATAFHRAGARVVIADIDGEAAVAAAMRLDASGETAVGHRVDVADEVSVKALRDAIDWPVDTIVNNAAIFSKVPVNRGTFEDITVPEFERMMSVNLMGTWLMCREFVPPMRERGYGKVINVASGTAFKGTASMAHYVASKAAVIALTKSVARTVGKDNVCVNCIAPGSTLSDTEPSDEVRELRKTAISDRAITRVQTPNDLIGAAVFFASSASDFITGQTLVVDGGSYMH